MSNANDRSVAPRPRVLCVDDNSDVLELEKLLLEREGYEVLVANNGVDGLKLARDSKVDLVVLDHEMPRMTGAEVAQLLRRVQPTLAILMVSGAGFPEEAAGIVDGFIPKPEIGASLVREVNWLLLNRKATCE